MIESTVGIDVSKAHLDAHAAPAGRSARFPNDPSGFRELLAWIGPETERVAYESTGAYHLDFEKALLKAGAPLFAVNPHHVRCFARSRGGRAKTDAADARTLAAMAAAIDDLRPTAAKSQAQRDLEELRLERDGLVRDRTAIGNRRERLRHPAVKRRNKRRLARIERQVKEVDGEIAEILQSDDELRRRCEILTSIPGVSDVTAAGLVAHMPELGSLTGPRAASLAGLAPVTRESGTWKGRSFIQGGGEKVRRLLHMPAVAAIRRNPDLAAKHQELRAAGKPPKVALTAVMRKLVILANVLVQQDRLWTPRPAAAK